jgi:hypothetical protein
VSTHPDVILAMGTEEILYRTRALGWGMDTRLYPTVEQLEDELPGTLGEGRPRVLKQHRGNGGLGVDQPMVPRHVEGMVRCYVVHDRVAGFGYQRVTALMDPPAGESAPPVPEPRVYYRPAKPEFQALKAQLESEWIPEMQALLAIDTDRLPALWDADFLLGPRTAAGLDTYLLCETNMSSVFPFPDEAREPLARAVAARVRGSRP